MKYKTGSGRGTFRTEEVRVSQLSPKLPKTKGLALIVSGERCGTVVEVKRLVRVGNKPTGVQVLDKGSGEEWSELIDSVTKVEPADASADQ